jgi:hypothetical protein
LSLKDTGASFQRYAAGRAAPNRAATRLT